MGLDLKKPPLADAASKIQPQDTLAYRPCVSPKSGDSKAAGPFGTPCSALRRGLLQVLATIVVRQLSSFRRH
jgi:hypothetical protein